MRVEEITNDELWKQVVEEMRLDGHGVPRPTHAVLSDDGKEVIGAYSLHFAPCLFFWMHTKRGTAITSYRALRGALGQITELGYETPLLLIQRESPFYPYVKKMGFRTMMAGELMIQAGG